jgi:hypothetical protein
MTEAKTAGIAEALNRLQAELKPIRRNTEGQVGQRKRKYADLAAVTEAVYPLLGKYGLSFSAKPTLRDGRFVLAYALRHVSGEEDAGDWPLNGGGSQQIGSEITYARRYCLCAITGAVPEGEDDDGHSAQEATEEDWRSQPPVRRHRDAHTGAAAVQDMPDVSEWEAGAAEAAQGIADEAAEARTVSDVSALHAKSHDRGLLGTVIKNPATGGKGPLGKYLTWRRSQLSSEARALAELRKAGEAAGLEGDVLDERVRELTGADIETATVAQMKEAAAKLAGAAS